MHLNAYFPALVILHVVQLFFYHSKYTFRFSIVLFRNITVFFTTVLISQDWYSATFVGNTLWLIAVGYYVYINFLGYNCK